MIIGKDTLQPQSDPSMWMAYPRCNAGRFEKCDTRDVRHSDLG